MSQMMFLLHVASVALLLALALGYAVDDEELMRAVNVPTGTIILLDLITVSVAQPSRVQSCVLTMECISVLTTS